MLYTFEPQDACSLAHITYSGESIAYAALSIDIHTKNSTEHQAIAHVYEHALLSGAGDLSREQFLDAINMLGAEIAVSLTHGTLTITLRCTSASLKKTLALFSLILQSPRFDAKEIVRIKTLVKNELTEYAEQARPIATDMFVKQLFKASDRRHHASPETLKKYIDGVRKQDLVTIHEAVQRGFWYASIAATQRSVELFTHTIRSLRSDYPLVLPHSMHAPRAPRSTAVLTDIPSKHNIEYSIGGPLPITLHHPDYVPFVFGLHVLGKWSGFAGRLMSTVREKEGLTYGIYARTEAVRGTETGYWRIMTFFSPERSIEGLTSTLREVKHIKEKGITTHEHRRFKTILETQESLLLDSVTSALSDIHAYHVAGFTHEELLSYKQRLLTVSKAAVNNALKQYLDLDSLVISGAGPVTPVAPALKRFMKSV